MSRNSFLAYFQTLSFDPPPPENFSPLTKIHDTRMGPRRGPSLGHLGHVPPPYGRKGGGAMPPPPIWSEKIKKLRGKWRKMREKSALRAVLYIKIPYFCPNIVYISENFRILPRFFEKVTSRDVKMTSFLGSRDMKMTSFWIMPPLYGKCTVRA